MGAGQILVGRKSLSCKWVFRYKYVSDSEKPKYKARLVLKGFKQEHKSKIDPIRPTKRAKSIESECQEAEDATLSKDTNCRRDDQGANKPEDRSRIQ